MVACSASNVEVIDAVMKFARAAFRGSWKKVTERPMMKFSLAVLTTTAAVVLSAMPGGIPSARAGDLGDGGYGAAPYGHHQPYYSGQDDDHDDGRNSGRYGRSERNDDDGGGDDDDDRRSYSHSGDDNDDNGDYDNGDNDNGDYDDQGDLDQRSDNFAPRRYGSTKDGYEPEPRAGIVRPHRAGCVPGWKVKRRLIGGGWADFQLNNYGQGVAVIRARRVHTGRGFILKVDGCTGEVLSSVPLGNRYYSDGRPTPRRYSWRN